MTERQHLIDMKASHSAKFAEHLPWTRHYSRCEEYNRDHEGRGSCFHGADVLVQGGGEGRADSKQANK